MTQYLVSTATVVMQEGYAVYVNKMENKIYVQNNSEKPLVLDLLKIYKENECLWNANSPFYGNKVAKSAAYVQMLKRYKLFDPNADMKMVRRRIDNLRSSYRREHKKVLRDKRHLPGLWYYRSMTFLNDSMTFPLSPIPTYDDGNENPAAGGSGDGLQPKKRLFVDGVKDEVKDDESGAEENYITEYLENETEEDVHQEETYQIKLKEEPYVIQPKEVATEASVFGRAVGLQLDELTAMQKTIAEKLISDVIYNARLDRYMHKALKKRRRLKRPSSEELCLQLDELTAMQKTIAEKLISDVIYNARLDRLTTQTCLINLNTDDYL